MQFSTIQNGRTRAIERWYLDGRRVSREAYLMAEIKARMNGARFSTFTTETLKNGNFKHSKHSNL